jgi:malate synthase
VTPGEWSINEHKYGIEVVAENDWGVTQVYNRDTPTPIGIANAEFIAQSKEIIQWLLDRNAELLDEAAQESKEYRKLALDRDYKEIMFQAARTVANSQAKHIDFYEPHKKINVDQEIEKEAQRLAAIAHGFPA